MCKQKIKLTNKVLKKYIINDNKCFLSNRRQTMTSFNFLKILNQTNG